MSFKIQHDGETLRFDTVEEYREFYRDEQEAEAELAAEARTEAQHEQYLWEVRQDEAWAQMMAIDERLMGWAL